MDKIKSFIAAAILLGAVMTGCKQKVSENLSEDTVAAQVPEDLRLATIESYLVDSIGMKYATGEVCIPAYSVINIEEPAEPSDTPEAATDTKVWGDWWVFNYNIAGDTLKCVSGGSHPGMFQLHKEGEVYRIVAFDQVEDGAGNLPNAQRIFGDLYDDFHAVNSNKELRDSVRLAMVTQYVREHNLPVTMLQDYGWPAVLLPTE